MLTTEGINILPRLYFLCGAALLLLTAAAAAPRQPPGPARPSLIIQRGHNLSVHSVKFSPDGKVIASASNDSTIKLWHASDGTLLQTIAGASAVSVDYTPDGKYLVGGGSEGIKFFDADTGDELRERRINTPVFFFALSPDGKTLAARATDGTIRLWDAEGGDEGRVVASDVGIGTLAFSRDGRTLAGIIKTKAVRQWDVSTGAEKTTIEGNSEITRAIAFNPAGNAIACVGMSKDRKGEVLVFDANTGKRLLTPAGHSRTVSSVLYSHDGKLLTTGSIDETVKLWDAETGRELRTIKGQISYADCLDFSPDDESVAVGSINKRIGVWDVQNCLRDAAACEDGLTLAEHSQFISSLHFGLGGKILVAGAGSIHHPGLGGIALWDARSGVERTLDPGADLVRDIAISPDGKLLASANSTVYGSGRDDFIKFWNLETQKEVLTIDDQNDVPFVCSYLAFSPDGTKLVGAGSRRGDYTNHELVFWKVADGSVIRRINDERITATAFDPSGDVLATGANGGVTLWNARDGSRIKTLPGHGKKEITSIAFSPDGKFLASGDRGDAWGSDKRAHGEVKLWDAKSGEELDSFEGFSQVSFSPDSSTLIYAGPDSTVEFWNILQRKRGEPIDDEGETWCLTPDGKILATVNDGVTIHLWETQGRRQLATLISVDKSDWLVATPDGLFDGSPAAWRNILWRFSKRLYDFSPVEAFFNEFYYTNLLTELFNDARPKAETNIAQRDRRQPRLKLTRADGRPPKEPVAARQLEVEIEIEDNDDEGTAARATGNVPPASTTGPKSGAKDVRLFRNGSLVHRWYGDAFSLGGRDGCKSGGQNRMICTATITVVAGENQLTAYAFNHDNIKSADAQLTLRGAENLRRKGVAYVLAVGVNRYDNPNYELKFAETDAVEFSKEFKRQQEEVLPPAMRDYTGVETALLLNEQAKKAQILQALSRLAGDTTPLPENSPLTKLKKAEPEDAVVIYFAGHGKTVETGSTAKQTDGAAATTFYLIPHDMGYKGERKVLTDGALRQLISHSISTGELEKALEKIYAGQILLVIDSCYSGGLLEMRDRRLGPMNNQGLAQLAYEKGMYILTAAQSYEVSKESAKLGAGHGFLTYALLEGLTTNAANADLDDIITEREWLDYSMLRVPQLQAERDAQCRADIQCASENMVATSPLVGQRPRLFHRREVDVRPLVVAKP